MPFEEPDKFAVLSLPTAGLLTLLWSAWRMDAHSESLIMILGVPTIEYSMHWVDSVAPPELVFPRVKIARLLVAYVLALILMTDQTSLSDLPFSDVHAWIVWIALVLVSLCPLIWDAVY